MLILVLALMINVLLLLVAVWGISQRLTTFHLVAVFSKAIYRQGNFSSQRLTTFHLVAGQPLNPLLRLA